jgi:hypothetical protein
MIFSCPRLMGLVSFDLSQQPGLLSVGGHLGNLHVPAVQQRVLKLFSENAE